LFVYTFLQTFLVKARHNNLPTFYEQLISKFPVSIESPVGNFL